MPTWRRAVAQAKIKAHLMIGVANAFASAGGVHPSTDYAEQLAGLVYFSCGHDLSKVPPSPRLPCFLVTEETLWLDAPTRSTPFRLPRLTT